MYATLTTSMHPVTIKIEAMMVIGRSLMEEMGRAWIAILKYLSCGERGKHGCDNVDWQLSGGGELIWMHG